jgi:hypothetical protein
VNRILRMAELIKPHTEPLQEPAVSCDLAISCLIRLGVQNGGAARIEAARKSLAGQVLPLLRLVELIAEFGLHAECIWLDWQGLKTAVLTHPLLIVRNNFEVVVVTANGRPGTEEVSVWDPHHDGVVFFVSREDFERAWSGHALIMRLRSDNADAQVLASRSRNEATFAKVDDSSLTPNSRKRTPPGSEPTANAPKFSSRGGGSWRSLAPRLGFSAIAIVATAGIAGFFFTYSAAEHVTDPSTPSPAAAAPGQSGLANPMDGASATGAATAVETAPIPEAGLTAKMPSPGPTGKRANNPPLSAPMPKTNGDGPAPPAQGPVTVTSPISAVPSP